MTRVEWTHTAETSRLLRLLALVGFGAIGAVPLLGALLALWLVVAVVAAGDFEALGIILVFGLFFGALAGRRLALHVELFRREDSGMVLWLSFRQLAAASAVWAAFVVATALLDAPVVVVYALFVVAIFVALPVVAALTSEGTVDTDTDELRVNQNEVSLAAIESVARYDLGPVAVLRVRYHDGAASVSSPRLLGVAQGDASRVREAIESSTAEPPASDRNPLVTKTLYAFGLGALALASLLGYYATRQSGDAVAFVGYAAALAALFGALFVWLGYIEG